MINLQQKISSEILRFLGFLGLQRPTVLLGLSGGADSTFLFLILQQLHEQKKINLFAVHINHGWREEAGEDERFCKELAERFAVPVFLKNASDCEVARNGSLEELGRKIRRKIFAKIRKEIAADLIALAHHSDDQLETFFIRLARGSSLQGLGGMLEWTSPFYRPLLGVAKSEILGSLKILGQDFCLDESNESDQFLRNRIRKYLIPILPQADFRIARKTLDTMSLLQQEFVLLQDLVAQQFSQLWVEGEPSGFDREKFSALSNLLQKKLLQMLLRKYKISFSESQAFFNELLRFLKREGGGSHQISTWILCKNKKVIFVQI